MVPNLTDWLLNVQAPMMLIGGVVLLVILAWTVRQGRG